MAPHRRTQDRCHNSIWSFRVCVNALRPQECSTWPQECSVPSNIVTACGRQFESQLWKALMTLLRTKHAQTTAYHTQTNGMVERFHHQLKTALRTHHNPATWMDSLPLVLFGIRTAVKVNIPSTAAEMVYGTTLRLPGEFFTLSLPSSVIDTADFLHNLKVTYNSFTPHPLAPLSIMASSAIPCHQLPMSSSDMMPYVNHSSLHMMDCTQWSNH